MTPDIFLKWTKDRSQTTLRLKNFAVKVMNLQLPLINYIILLDQCPCPKYVAVSGICMSGTECKEDRDCFRFLMLNVRM